MWGHESNPMYEQSPTRLQSAVLEKRVFKTPNKMGSANKPMKKRVQTAKSQNGRMYPARGMNGAQVKSNYANPGDRP